MKPIIKDALQFIVAILITGSVVFAQELPQNSIQSNPVPEVTQTKTVEQEIAPAPVIAEAPKEEPTPVVEPIPEPVVAPKPVVAAYTPSGNQYQWLLDSGIPQEYWRAVDYIVSRESGWKPCAYYPGGNDCNAQPTGACGLVQQNPCGKIGGDWRDPVAALKWADGYVKDRYGGWPGAYNYWIANGHY